MPRPTKAVTTAIESFGFEFSEPPTKVATRRGKHTERWEAARVVCENNPNRPVKVLTYNQASSAYSTAKAINNDEHKSFPDAAKGEEWLAVAGQDPSDTNPAQHAIWLKYVGA